MNYAISMVKSSEEEIREAARKLADRVETRNMSADDAILILRAAYGPEAQEILEQERPDG